MKHFISKKELEEMMSSNTPVCVFDVRDEEEYMMQHLPFAGNLPLKIFEENLFIPEPNKIVVTVCGKGGGRSERAAYLLRENYQSEAYFLAGGTFGWSEES